MLRVSTLLSRTIVWLVTHSTLITHNTASTALWLQCGTKEKRRKKKTSEIRGIYDTLYIASLRDNSDRTDPRDILSVRRLGSRETIRLVSALRMP